MKKRIFSILLTVVLILGMVPTAVFAAAPADYTILLQNGNAYKNEVGGEVLTGIGITGSGSTYTFDNVNFETTASAAIKVLDTEATIRLTGSNTVRSGEAGGYAAYGILTYNNLTITGSGSLNVAAGSSSSSNSYGLYSECSLTVTDTTVRADGGAAGEAVSYGIFAYESITLTNSTVTGVGGDYGIYDDCYYAGDTLTVNGGSVTGIGNSAGIYLSGGTSPVITGMEVFADTDVSGNNAVKVNDWADSYRSYKYVRIASSAAYTVEFNANGGSGRMDSVTVYEGGTYTLPECEFTAPAGKEFRGWATSADGDALSGTTMPVTGNVTLYAVWGKLPSADDYPGCTLVLYRGQVYKDSTDGILLADTGITGAAKDSGYLYTFDGVNFETTAAKAVEIRDSAATIELKGTNVLRGGDADTAAYGIYASGSLTVTGTGSLDVAAGDSATGDSCGILAWQSLTVDGGNVTASSGEANGLSAGVYAYSSMLVQNGTLLGNGRYAGIYVYSFLTVTGGTITGNGDSFGIYAECMSEGDNLTVSGGTVTGVGSFSGIYVESDAEYPVLDGVTIYCGTNSSGNQVTASDDWMDFAAGSKYKYVKITDSTATPVTGVVRFDANGGSGYMYAAVDVTGSYPLPECTFTAPEGKRFCGWATAPDGNVLAGTSVTVSEGMTLYAVWEDAVVVPVAGDYTIFLSGGKVSKNNANGTVLTDTGITYADGVYTFDNVNFETTAQTAVKIEDSDAVLRLVGTNNITSGSTTGFGEPTYGIYAVAGNLTIDGTGTLNVTGGSATGNGSSSSALCVYDSSLNPEGVLTIKSGTIRAASDEAVAQSRGIMAGYLVMEGGTVTAISGTGANSMAIWSNKSVTIRGGTVSATAANQETSYGIYTGSAEGGITILGGTVTLTAGYRAVGTPPMTQVNGQNVMTVLSGADAASATEVSGWIGEGTSDDIEHIRCKYMRFEPKPSSGEPHTHSWTYTISVDGATVHAACEGSGVCDYTGQDTMLTISAPTLTVEGGDGSAEATLSSPTLLGQTMRILYVERENGSTLENAPTTAGKYSALCKYKGEYSHSDVIKVDYTIAAVGGGDVTTGITIDMTDTFGDGWDGAAAEVWRDGRWIMDATMTEGYRAQEIVPYDASSEYVFKWRKGSFDEECGLTITLPGASVPQYSRESMSAIAEGEILVTVSSPGVETPVFYTVSFDSNGGSGTMASVTVEAGEMYALPECEFTAPAGKPYFLGWATSSDGAALAWGEYSLTKDTVLYAVWSALPGYTLVLYEGEGYADADLTDLDHGTLLDLGELGIEGSYDAVEDIYIYTLDGLNFTTQASVGVYVADYYAALNLKNTNVIQGGSSDSAEYLCGLKALCDLTFTGTGKLDVTAGNTNREIDTYGIYVGEYAYVNGGTITANGGSGNCNYSCGFYMFEETLTVTGGSLTGNGGTAYYDSDGIYVYDNLVIRGGTVTGNGGDVVYEDSNGIYVESAIEVTGGTLIGNGGKACEDSVGISGEYDVRITDSTVTAVGGTSDCGSYGLSVYGMCDINGSTVTARGGTATEYTYGLYCSDYRDEGFTIVDSDVTATIGDAAYGCAIASKGVAITGDSTVIADATMPTEGYALEFWQEDSVYINDATVTLKASTLASALWTDHGDEDESNDEDIPAAPRTADEDGVAMKVTAGAASDGSDAVEITGWGGLGEDDVRAYKYMKLEAGTETPHVHGNGTLVNGWSAGTETAGQKDYYECSCGEWFWDADCTRKITDRSEVTIPATGGGDAENGKLTVSVSDISARAGEKGVVTTVSVENIPADGLGKLVLAIAYDDTVLRLTGAEDLGALGKFTEGSLAASLYLATWTNAGTRGPGSEVLVLTFDVLRVEELEAGKDLLTVTVSECVDADGDNLSYGVENPEVSVIVPGDANGDGYISGKDLILLRQYMAEMDVTLDEDAADVNRDGYVSGKDVILMRQYLAEWDVELQ